MTSSSTSSPTCRASMPVGRARITHQQNLTFRWVPEKALYEVWQQLSDIGFGGAGAHEITDIVSCLPVPTAASSA